MKTYILIFNLFIYSTMAIAQTSEWMNRIVQDKNGNPMVLGPCDTSVLGIEPFASWFHTGLTRYVIDTACCDSLRPYAAGSEVLLFFGSWCGDSRREVPRMLKVLYNAGFTNEQIKLIGLGNGDTLYKQSPTHEERGMDIKKVPTLVMRIDGHESGRVVESPIESIEKDLLKMAMQRAYPPTLAH
ncbi:MAG TPA: thioredoxin family protein [Phnomibacter sp.]|nr:thioredoxin family protein [Phnomibacter sp.]